MAAASRRGFPTGPPWATPSETITSRDAKAIMRALTRPIPLLLASAVALSGCARLADSRLNPSNWFGSGGGAVAAVGASGEVEPLVPDGARTLVLDARPLLAEVTSVSLDRTPDGAILRATGRASSQGWFNADLVLTAIEGGTATYAFRAEAPRGFAAAGTPASRQITAAVNLDLAELQGIRRFRVEGASGARSVSR